VQRFRGGLVFKAHRLLYHSTLGSRVIKKKGTDLEVIARQVHLRERRVIQRPPEPIQVVSCSRRARISGSEAGSYLRLIDSCITQLKVQGLSRNCNESKEEGGRTARFVHEPASATERLHQRWDGITGVPRP